LNPAASLPPPPFHLAANSLLTNNSTYSSPIPRRINQHTNRHLLPRVLIRISPTRSRPHEALKPKRPRSQFSGSSTSIHLSRSVRGGIAYSCTASMNCLTERHLPSAFSSTLGAGRKCSTLASRQCAQLCRAWMRISMRKCGGDMAASCATAAENSGVHAIAPCVSGRKICVQHGESRMDQLIRPNTFPGSGTE
jgi:hypothetical protein